MKKDIRERANINPGPNKETVLRTCILWTKTSLQENGWNRDVDDKIVTIIELKEALKTKNVSSPSKDKLNSELYKYADD
jgi:hypothetical protein